MIEFIIDLKKFPDWAVPMTKIIPIFYVADGWDKTLIDWNYNFTYVWKKIDDENYQIKVTLTGSAKIDDEDIPLFVDVDLILLNERIWHELQPNKT